MLLRDKLTLLLVICWVVTPGKALLLPLLFPLSIRITFHSNTKPTHAPTSYHFESVPVYREVVVKGSAHISPASPVKQSYGDGQKYGTSYGDGHVKVYTEEPHIRGHKYASGYVNTGTGGSIDGHFSISSYPASEPDHYKGSPYAGNGGGHYKGVSYPQTGYKGISDVSYDHEPEIPTTHYKGSTYVVKSPPTHYKGTAYGEKVPQTHYKGTAYEEKVPQTHYKGTAYEEDVPTHYKGTPYEDTPVSYTPYKGNAKKPKLAYNPHEYIKAVGGGYKVSDFVNEEKIKYPQDDDQYIEIPAGQTYADYEAAHKAAHAPKAYSADQYSDLGSTKYKKDHEHDPSYLDDTLPIYKTNIPKPRPPRPQYNRYQASANRYQASADRYDRILPESSDTSTTKTTYAGFGSSIYGDSYAKIVYVPRNLRISIRAYAHN